MRTSRRCVKCQCPRLWHVDPVMVPDTDSSNVVELLPAVARAGSGAAVTGEFKKRVEAGRFEVWICSACGYTEWYAHEVNDMLAWLSRNPRSGVRYSDADAAS
ncbi:hypothetical protein ABZS66_44945 [Dactylosporangium sp. NPDC005572]|uniref:hypothetical protein n=1 Tax=Dactylosporangium sp. NPDC005572 TaxID=3156889 RepID=UPI0033A214CD